MHRMSISLCLKHEDAGAFALSLMKSLHDVDGVSIQGFELYEDGRNVVSPRMGANEAPPPAQLGEDAKDRRAKEKPQKKPAPEKGTDEGEEDGDPTVLPSGIPYLGTLRKSDKISGLDDVVALAEAGELTSISGVGGAGAGKIRAWLEENGHMDANDADTEGDDEDAELQRLLGGDEDDDDEGEETKLTEEDIRKELSTLGQNLGLSALQKVLNSVGASKVSDLDPEDYPAVYQASKKARKAS